MPFVLSTIASIILFAMLFLRSGGSNAWVHELFMGAFLRRRSPHGQAYVPAWLVGIALAASFTFGTCVVALVMLIFGISLDIATGAIVITVLALASDACLYPVIRFLELLETGAHPRLAMKIALEDKGEAVIVDGVTNSIGLVPLVRSMFSPVAYLGILAIIAMWACIAWSLAVALPIMEAGVKPKEDIYATEGAGSDFRGRYVVNNS